MHRSQGTKFQKALFFFRNFDNSPKLWRRCIFDWRCFSFFISFFIASTTFAYGDISVDDPYHHSFVHLREVGVMTPYQDGNFHPEKIVTRAEALTIAMRAGGFVIPEDFGGETYYADVDPNAWFAPIVHEAVNRRVIINKSDFFRPNDAVGKAEFLAFLFRATKVDFGPYFSRTRNIAMDIPADAWFAPHFAYAKKYQIAHLPSDKFYHPYKALSRREVGIMAYRQLHLFHGDTLTRTFVELQGEIQQFLQLLQSGKQDEAEMRLRKIVKLNRELTRIKNNSEAVAARYVSRAMTYLAESLRYFRHGHNLAGVENLYLASRQVEKAKGKAESFLPFVNELARLIDETMKNFTGNQVARY